MSTIDIDTFELNAEHYGRKGYRHGLRDLRPDHFFWHCRHYRRGYLRGVLVRAGAQVFVVAGFAIAIGSAVSTF